MNLIVDAAVGQMMIAGGQVQDPALARALHLGEVQVHLVIVVVGLAVVVILAAAVRVAIGNKMPAERAFLLTQ